MDVNKINVALEEARLLRRIAAKLLDPPEIIWLAEQWELCVANKDEAMFDRLLAERTAAQQRAAQV